MLILFNKNKLLKLHHRERKIGANDWIYFSLYSFMIWKGNLFEKDTDYFYMQIYDELQKRYILHSKPLISFSRKYLGFGDRPSFNIFDSLPKISKNEVLYIKEYEVLKSNLNSYIQDKKGRITVFRVEDSCRYDLHCLNDYDLAQYKQIHFDRNLSEKIKRDFLSSYENITKYVHSRIEEILEEKEIDPLIIIIS